jgi:hypothetical protein
MWSFAFNIPYGDDQTFNWLVLHPDVKDPRLQKSGDTD